MAKGDQEFSPPRQNGGHEQGAVFDEGIDERGQQFPVGWRRLCGSIRIIAHSRQDD